MSDYTRLNINRLQLSWNYYIPTFLTFLFRPEDYHCLREPASKYDESDDEILPVDLGIDEIGYRTTCAKALVTMNEFGYTLDFFADMYETLRTRLFENYEYNAKQDIVDSAKSDLNESKIETRFQSHLRKFPKKSPRAELQDYVEFIRLLFAGDLSIEPFRKPYILKYEVDGSIVDRTIPAEEFLKSKRWNSKIDFEFEDLQLYVMLRTLDYPPWIPMITELFDENYRFHYPEIISLLFARIILEASPGDAEVYLDLRDICETEQEAKSLHTTLVSSIVDKVTLYNRVFQVLFANESSIRDKYIKSECKNLLSDCMSASSNSEKGSLLERLIVLLFTSPEELMVVNKNVMTGDEEIDVVIKNNINRPFWLAFSSPLFFVECKNWSSKVGAKELRDFEGKLRNHGNLAKVGFFVSLNGFTSQVEEELKRAGRDGHHVVLIKGSNIEHFCASNTDVFTWLEQLASTIH